jgi:Raf kinase inhibitor-like YbhB/YbcL family protein
MFRTVAATLLATVLLSTLAAACSSSDGGDDDAGLPAAAAAADAPAAEGGDSVVTQEFDLSIELTSSVFSRIRRIPLRHTCTVMKDIVRPTTDSAVKTSENWSPPLSWTGLPEGTKSVALIFDGTDNVVDPKSPDEPLAVHWLIWNIPPSVTELAEAVATTTQLVDLGPRVTQGLNADGFHGYTGPCPPLQAAYSIGGQGYHGQTARSVDQFYFKIYALDIELDLGPDATRDDLLKAMDGHIVAGGELKGEFIQKPQYSG